MLLITPDRYLSEGLANRAQFSIVDFKAHPRVILHLAQSCPLSTDPMASQFEIVVVAMEDVRPIIQTGVS